MKQVDVVFVSGTTVSTPSRLPEATRPKRANTPVSDGFVLGIALLQDGLHRRHMLHRYNGIVPCVQTQFCSTSSASPELRRIV